MTDLHSASFSQQQTPQTAAITVVTIRPLQPSELEDYHALTVKTFRHAWSKLHLPHNLNQFIEEHLSLSSLTTLYEQEDTYAAMAWLDNAPVGYCLLQQNQLPSVPCDMPGTRPLQLKRIYVDHEVQSRGVGTQLITHALTFARTHTSADCMWLTVWRENVAAQRFYKRHEFKKVSHEDQPFVVGTEVEYDWIVARGL